MHMHMYMISDTYKIQSSLMLHTQALSAGKQFTATVSFPLNMATIHTQIWQLVNDYNKE